MNEFEVISHAYASIGIKTSFLLGKKWEMMLKLSSAPKLIQFQYSALYGTMESWNAHITP